MTITSQHPDTCPCCSNTSKFEVTYWKKGDKKENNGKWMEGESFAKLYEISTQLINKGNVGRLFIHDADGRVIFHYHIQSHHRHCGDVPIGHIFF